MAETTLELAGMTIGEAIREYLQTVHRGNPYSFYKIYRQFKKTTSYEAVWRYFWILKQIGLIQPLGTAPSKAYFRKRLYQLVPGKEEDVAWWHPQMELYPGTKLGSKGYAKMKAQGLKPRGGRARKYRA
jgi:hypothetical protein